jgi:hypothetical protein
LITWLADFDPFYERTLGHSRLATNGSNGFAFSRGMRRYKLSSAASWPMSFIW